MHLRRNKAVSKSTGNFIVPGVCQIKSQKVVAFGIILAVVGFLPTLEGFTPGCTLGILGRSCFGFSLLSVDATNTGDTGSSSGIRSPQLAEPSRRQKSRSKRLTAEHAAATRVDAHETSASVHLLSDHEQQCPPSSAPASFSGDIALEHLLALPRFVPQAVSTGNVEADEPAAKVLDLEFQQRNSESLCTTLEHKVQALTEAEARLTSELSDSKVNHTALETHALELSRAEARQTEQVHELTLVEDRQSAEFAQLRKRSSVIEGVHETRLKQATVATEYAASEAVLHQRVAAVAEHRLHMSAKDLQRYKDDVQFNEQHRELEFAQHSLALKQRLENVESALAGSA